MMQLWVNLPAKVKMTPPRYQAITSNTTPTCALPDGAAPLASSPAASAACAGPARTFSPMQVWDVRLAQGKLTQLPVRAGLGARR